MANRNLWGRVSTGLPLALIVAATATFAGYGAWRFAAHRQAAKANPALGTAGAANQPVGAGPSALQPNPLAKAGGNDPAPAVAGGNAIGAVESPPRSEAAVAPGPKALVPAELAAKIDALLEKSWAEAKIVPAPLALDAEFLRRLSLDVAGKIPTQDAVRQYLDDKSPGKRAALVHRTLATARFANHLAVTFRDLLMPNAISRPTKRPLAAPFEAWLRLQFVDNRPYDQIVSDLVLALPTDAADPNAALRAGLRPGPEHFGLFHENKPEELASGVARSVLGVQVGCAQCHNHFFADWKQDQFWSFAALFAVSATGGAAEIAIPDKNRKVPARFLDGAEPKLASADAAGRRQALAEWLAHDNKYLARAAANRVWGHFFGRGIVHPVDDLDPRNAPSHPELLDLLALEFRRSGYDLKALSEALALTKAYALSSRGNQTDPAKFARMPVRHLGPEQLYDSLQRAAGRPGLEEPDNGPATMLGDRGRLRFAQLFAEPGDRTTPQGGIVQALALLNGEPLASAVDPARGPLLRAALRSPFLASDTERLEALFLASLSRRPAAEENTLLLAGIPPGADDSARGRAFGGIYWALLNSAEFSLVP